MAKKSSSDKFVVKYGETEATLYPRGEAGDGRWSINWSELGKRKSTTFKGTKKEAEKKAKQLVMSASRTNLGLAPVRNASKVEADALDRLAAIIGSRSLSLAISDLEQGVAKAGDWASAMRHLHTFTPDIAEVAVEGLYYRFMDRYDKLEPTSAHNPRKELSAVIAAYPGLMLSSIDLPFLETWIDRGDPAPLYFNTRLIVWRNFLSRCRDWGFIREGMKHVADKIPKRAEHKTSPPIITNDQLDAGLELLQGSHLVGFAVACFAGLRPSEVHRLKWDDVQEDYIFVRAENSKKTKAERYVPMQPRLWSILEGFKLDVGSHHKKGNVCTSYQWIKISRHLRAGETPILTKWPQDLLRHSFISHRLAQTSDIAQVADESGNSPEVIMADYRRPLKKEEGAKWFGEVAE